MRIDMVTPRFHPSVGGIEEAVAQMSIRLRRRGHDVRVHTGLAPGLSERDEWKGVPIVRYPLAFQRGYYVSRFEPRLEGEIIHLHAYAHHTNDWVLDHYPDRRVFLSTHHGARFPKATLSAKVYHSYYNRFVAAPHLRRVEAVLVPTAFDAEDFARRGVPRERIHVLASGADEAAFQSAEPLFPEGVDARKGFVLFLGRLHEEKGIRALLQAYKIAEVPTHLVLAGRDEGEADMVREAAAQDRRIHLVTDFGAQEKWGLLAGCRALVLPSRHEGQGIVIAEAWGQRKPVVATSVGALPTVVENGEDGLLVPFDNPGALAAAIRRVVADAPLAHRLGEAGRAKAERHYRWEPIIDRLEALYRAEGTRDERTGMLAGTPRA